MRKKPSDSKTRRKLESTTLEIEETEREIEDQRWEFSLLENFGGRIFNSAVDGAVGAVGHVYERPEQEHSNKKEQSHDRQLADAAHECLV